MPGVTVEGVLHHTIRNASLVVMAAGTVWLAASTLTVWITAGEPRTVVEVDDDGE